MVRATSWGKHYKQFSGLCKSSICSKLFGLHCGPDRGPWCRSLSLAIDLLAVYRLELLKSIARTGRCQHGLPEVIIIPYGTTPKKFTEHDWREPWTQRLTGVRASARSCTRQLPGPTGVGRPNQLNLQVLHQHSTPSYPMVRGVQYAEEFKKLDIQVLKKDLHALMTDSQEWWRPTLAYYGPLFIRMAWHSAGTYRIGDGRGVAEPAAAFRATQQLAGQREPRQGAPAAAIKQKYGNKISWADLMILTGRRCPSSSMGFNTLRRARCSGTGIGHLLRPRRQVAGRRAATAATGPLENPLAAVQMGLISYVNRTAIRIQSLRPRIFARPSRVWR